MNIAEVRKAMIEAVAEVDFNEFMGLRGKYDITWEVVMRNLVANPYAAECYEHWTNKAKRRLDAAFSAAQANSYKLVSATPTDDMDNAARDWSYTKYGRPVGYDGSRGCWDSQHKVAPSFRDK
jgi:hypothetical protein